jgi:hypothetical protein
MNAELIAVGTELLLGEIANTDGQFISAVCRSWALTYITIRGRGQPRPFGKRFKASGRPV